jgi:hypothetical protein
MSNITKFTYLYSDWKNSIEQKKIDALNQDLSDLGANVKISYETNPDGWTIKFFVTE